MAKYFAGFIVTKHAYIMMPPVQQSKRHFRRSTHLFIYLVYFHGIFLVFLFFY